MYLFLAMKFKRRAMIYEINSMIIIETTNKSIQVIYCGSKINFNSIWFLPVFFFNINFSIIVTFDILTD